MTSEMERQMNNAARLRAQTKLNAHLYAQFGPAISPDEAMKKIQAGAKGVIMNLSPKSTPQVPLKSTPQVPEPVTPPEPRYRRVILPRMEDLDEPVLC